MIERRCCYCGKFLGYAEDTFGRTKGKVVITNGACEECYKKELEKLKNTKCCICGRTDKPLLFMSICADCFSRKENDNDHSKSDT